MIKRENFKFSLALVGLMLFLFLTQPIRFLNYATVPEPYLVLDEKTNVLHGLSFRTTGIPAAWSDLRSYWEVWDKQKANVEKQGVGLSGFNVTLGNTAPSIFQKDSLPELAVYTGEFDFGQGKHQTLIIQPYLDHPLFGAIVLSSLVSSSAKQINDLSLTDFRKTSVALTYVTAILLFILAFLMFKSVIPALLATITYISIPTVVLVSRMALLENVLIPLQLVVLILLTLHQQKISKKFNSPLLIIAGVFAGLAMLTKTVGVAVIIASVIFLVFTKSTKKQILTFMIPSILIGSLYYLWGLFLSPDVFIEVLREQSTRRIFTGSLSFIQSFIKFGLPNFPLDGWWIGGFLSILFIKGVRENYLFLITFIALLFTVFFTGASNFAWYVLPLVPFMCISLGYLLWQIIDFPTTKHILMVFLFLFSSSLFWGWGVNFAAPNFHGHEQSFFVYKVLMLVFLLAAFIAPRLQNKNFKMIWKLFASVMIIAMIWLNYQSIIFMINHWGSLQDFYTTNWNF